MKAIVYRKYGLPDVLKLEEIPKPVPRDDEVLVSVYAASVNSWDWDLVRGKPLLYRLISGLLKPKYKVIGSDIAGRVEAVGSKVTQFRPGDEVYGDISGSGFGAFAEYACGRENELAMKPANLTFEEAAAVPQAAVLALQGLRDNGKFHTGQKVLINGAGGGVGTFAVQIAKLHGAEVTAVDAAEKLYLLHSVGADHTVDYMQEDFTKTGHRYDLVLDVLAYRSVFDYRRALSPQGVFVMVGGSVSRIFQMLFLGTLISMTGRKKMGILMHRPNAKDLDVITTLLAAGKVVPVIDRCYPLSKVPDALRHLGEGHVKGKIIITIPGKDPC